MPRPAAILDVDGTLVDTNYHHAVAWFRALRQHGQIVPIWLLHRAIGMGGDQLVQRVTSEGWDLQHGKDVRAAEKVLYMELIDEVEPLPGAADFVRLLAQDGHEVVLASSAKATEADHYVELLAVRDVVTGWTTSADVQATKPEPDLVRAAQEKVEAKSAVLVGDSVWDVEAAKRAGVKTIALRTGGFGVDELEKAGAAAVFDSIADLREGIGKTPLRA